MWIGEPVDAEEQLHFGATLGAFGLGEFQALVSRHGAVLLEAAQVGELLAELPDLKRAALPALAILALDDALVMRVAPCLLALPGEALGVLLDVFPTRHRFPVALLRVGLLEGDAVERLA